LPPSSFYALWAENFPEGQGSVLWLADPRDIGSRREVLRFDRDAIIEATLSPNGRKLALVTTYWKTSTLWVANADGTDLRQFDQGLSPPLEIRGLSWSRDSRMLTYVGFVAGEQTIIDKAGTPVVEPALLDTIELLDVTTGQKQHLVEVNPNEALFVIGWSTNGRELYYVRREIGYGYGLWVIDRISRKANKVIFLGTGDEPFFSLPKLFPDGSKFLLNTPEGRAWISIDGRTRQDIPVPPWRQQCGLTWSVNKDELILCEVDEKEPIEHIKILNLQTGEKRVLVSFRFPSDHTPFSPIAVSPDMQWMAAGTYWMTAGTYYVKDYWIHTPTGMLVPVPCPPDGYCFFVAWVPRMKAG
jgi:Tol biopolymer transport system component